LIAEGKPSHISYFIITNVSPGRDVHKYKAPVPSSHHQTPFPHPSFTSSEEFHAQKNAEERKKERVNSMQAPVQSCTRSISPVAVLLKECVKSYYRSCHMLQFLPFQPAHLVTGPKGKKVVKRKIPKWKREGR
jgi:hypothetical protein